MKAHEAREVAKAKKMSDHITGMEKVMDRIKHYAKGGHFDVRYFETSVLSEVPKSVWDELESMGYKIEKTFSRNDASVKISW